MSGPVLLCPQTRGHVWHSDDHDDEQGRPICMTCGGRGPENYARRRPYEPPAITSERNLDSTWQVGHALLECIREMPPGERLLIRRGFHSTVWVECSTPPEEVLKALQMLRRMRP